MQGGRGGGGNFFDPFAGFGGHGSLIPSVFGGRDPFDDPFFTSPIGGTPFRSMFESSIFGAGGSPFVGSTPSRFLEHQLPMPYSHPYDPPQSNIQRGPIIEELDSDDEREADEGATQWRDNPGMHSRSRLEPFIEYPDSAAEERMNGQIQFPNDYNWMNSMQSQPQSQSFSFHSSSVTYGGGNGTCYTKSSTRRTGSDGVTFEEQKEADSTTGKAFHQVSRGLYDKGHTSTRNLNSDGRVDNMQTLHNLNQDELAGFEESWKGKAKKHLPGVSERLNGFNNIGRISAGQDGHTSRGGWALPSTEQSRLQAHPQPHSGAVSVEQDEHTTTGGWAVPCANHPPPQTHPNAKRVRTSAASPSDPTASGSRMYGNEFQGRT